MKKCVFLSFHSYLLFLSKSASLPLPFLTLLGPGRVLTSRLVPVELVSKELNHLASILHVYARALQGFEFYEVKKFVIIFQKENGNTFTLLIIFIVKSLQKEQNSTNLLL